MDDSLIGLNELQIVVQFSLSFFENVFPKYFDSDSKGSPANSTKVDSLISRDIEQNGVFHEGWVQFELYPINGLTEKFVSDSWSNVQSPSIFVVLISLEDLSGVSYENSHHYPLSYHFALLSNGQWIESLHGILKIWIVDDVRLCEIGTAEGTSVVLCNEGGFGQAVSAEFVFADSQRNGFKEDVKANGAAMIFVYLLAGIGLFLHCKFNQLIQRKAVLLNLLLNRNFMFIQAKQIRDVSLKIYDSKGCCIIKWVDCQSQSILLTTFQDYFCICYYYMVFQVLWGINNVGVIFGVQGIFGQPQNRFRIQFQLLNLLQMGSFRSQPDLVKHTVVKSGVGLNYAVSHMCGWRIYMEDAHITASPLTDKKNSLFAVFDGHGGPEVSTYVEKHFITELQANRNYQNKDYEKALRETFMHMDELLKTTGGKNQIIAIQKDMREKDNGPKYEEQSHAGCTANVVLITSDAIYCANSGDSRAIAMVDSKLVELSHDHKPEDPIQLDRITKAGGTVSYGRVNGGLNLSRALGDLEYKRGNCKPEQQMITANPDILKIKNQNVDFIIMGCDGIWQVKTNSQMLDWVSKKINRQVASQNIVEDLLDELVSKDSGNQYGMDNMSAILIKFDKKK